MVPLLLSSLPPLPVAQREIRSIVVRNRPDLALDSSSPHPALRIVPHATGTIRGCLANSMLLWLPGKCRESFGSCP